VSLITSTGINELFQPTPNIWYNAKEDVLVVNNNGVLINSIEVFDASGKKVIGNMPVNLIEVSTQNLCTGLYLAKVNSKQKNIIYKFLKQ
jgi:Secretion system C-terminal sorting domain